MRPGTGESNINAVISSFSSQAACSQYLMQKMDPQRRDPRLWERENGYAQQDVAPTGFVDMSREMRHELAELHVIAKKSGLNLQVEVVSQPSGGREETIGELIVFIMTESEIENDVGLFMHKTEASHVALGRMMGTTGILFPGGGQTNVYAVPVNGLDPQAQMLRAAEWLRRAVGNNENAKYFDHHHVCVFGSLPGNMRGRSMDIMCDTSYGSTPLILRVRHGGGQTAKYKTTEQWMEYFKNGWNRGWADPDLCPHSLKFLVPCRYYKEGKEQIYFNPAHSTVGGIGIPFKNLKDFVKGLKLAHEDLLVQV